MSRVAYLARPIDQAHHVGPELARMVENIRTVLVGRGYCVYSPADAWRAPAGVAPLPAVEIVNRGALHQADLVVAYLPSGVPSIGVPMEIEQAINLDRPVIAIVDTPSYALQRPGIWQIDGVLGDQLSDVLTVVEVAREMRAQRDPDQGAVKLVIRDGHELPKRAYPDDAGIDLTTVKDYVIHPGQFVDVHTQVDHVQLPPGYWGLITGRSSTLRRHKLHVPMAVIDPGWRGPLFIGVWNLGSEPVSVQPGDRLGQMILLPCNPAEVVSVDKVDDAARGLAGFGSTG